MKREWKGWTRRERHEASSHRLCPESAEGRGPQKGGVSIMKLSVASWMTVTKHIIWMVQVHSLGISRERLILTMSILIHQEGWIFWSIPRDRIYDERMSALHQNSEGIEKSIPSALKISLDPRDFSREISRVSGNLLGVGDEFPNTSLVLVEHGYKLVIH